MGQLGLKFLGSPEVRMAGRPVKFRSRKALALLAYLVVEGGEHPRERLISLLWPRSGRKQGPSALRSTLSYLREPLRTEDGTEPLISGRASLSFNPASGLDLDLNVVRRGRALMREMSYSKSPAPEPFSNGLSRREIIEGLEAAASAYRGDFLEGFLVEDAPEFDGWLDVEREAWRRRAAGILDCLTGLHLEGGEFAEAVVVAERWAARSRQSEAAHRRLMQTLLASGDAGGALEAYEVCRTTLNKDFGTNPEAATDAVADRAREELRGPSRAAGRATEGLTSGDVLRVSGSSSGLPAFPLVGRSAEFRDLVRAYRKTLAGEPRGVAVLGEAGIGKTRLVGEFLLWAGAEGADVLRGVGFGAREEVPYGALLSLLRTRVEAERAPDDLLDDVWLSELSRLLPELRERYPDLPPPVADRQTDRLRLLEAASRLLTALSRRAPVVLFLDDAGLADGASLDALAYAAGRWREGGAPVTLILGARTGRSAGENLAPTLDRSIPVTQVRPGPLSLEDVERLVGTLETRMPGFRPAPQADRQACRLLAETGGNPRRLMQALDAMLGGGGPDAPDGPGGLEARNPLAGLSSAAADLVSAGAVLGGSFDSGRLFTVAGLGEDEALPALDEAVRVGLLKEVAVPGRPFADEYSLAEDGFAPAVYGALGAARRRVFHRRALAALEASGAGPAREFARHALAAGLPAEAFRYFLAAGDPTVVSLPREPWEVTERGASVRGLREIQSGRPRAGVAAARSVLQAGPSETPGASIRLALVVGLVEMGEYEPALEEAESGAADPVVARGDDPFSVVGLVALGIARRAAVRREASREAFRRALGVCEGLGERFGALVLSHLCAAEWLGGNPEAAGGRAVEAVEARAGLPATPLFGDFVRHHETAALLCSGKQELAHSETRSFGARIGDNPRYRIPYLRSLALVARCDGDPVGAVEALQAAALLAGRLGLPGEVWEIGALLGELCWALGDEGAARRHFRRARRSLGLLIGGIEGEELRSPFLEARELLRVAEGSLGFTKSSLPACTATVCPPEHRLSVEGLVPAGHG